MFRRDSLLQPTDILLATTQTPAFLCLFDRQRRLRWANRYAYGYQEASLLGTQTEAGVHEEDRPLWTHHMTMALDLGEVSTGFMRLVLAPVRLAYRLGPLRNRRGSICGAVSISWDVTFQDIPSERQFLLTPLGRRIVAWLQMHGPAKSATIGRALEVTSRDGHQATSHLRWKLANLEARGILRRTSEGYSVTPEFAALGI